MCSFIAIILLVLTGCGRQSSPTVEIDVIVSFLQERYASDIPVGTPLVIEDKLSERRFESEVARALLAKAPDRIPADLIGDFCNKTAKPEPVWPELGLRIQVKLLNSAEFDAFFSAKRAQKPDGWERFYTAYPKSPGVITISRVGFNKSGDMAMFYMGSQTGGHSGSGQIHFFRKQSGKWVEQPIYFGSSWTS